MRNGAFFCPCLVKDIAERHILKAVDIGKDKGSFNIVKTVFSVIENTVIVNDITDINIPGSVFVDGIPQLVKNPVRYYFKPLFSHDK